MCDNLLGIVAKYTFVYKLCNNKKQYSLHVMMTSWIIIIPKITVNVTELKLNAPIGKLV